MRERANVLRSAGIALLLVAWLVYWSNRLRPHEAALGLLVAVLLVALLANRIVPVPWVTGWNKPRIMGATSILAGCLLLVSGHVLRVDRFDPPRMDWEQVAPLAWWLSAILLLAGAWQLLANTTQEEAPACAACGATARDSKCVRCGAALV